MSARRSAIRRHLVGWGAFVLVLAIGTAFMASLIHGIVRGNATAHDLDHGNRLLNERLTELAATAGTAPIADLPFASDDPDWDVVCYVDAGHWVGKVVAERMGLDVRDLAFDPRNIYVVESYWGLGFLDLETRLLRIVEVNRKPVATIEGPACLARDDAEVAARPLEGDADRIVVSFVGAPVAVQ